MINVPNVLLFDYAVTLRWFNLTHRMRQTRVHEHIQTHKHVCLNRNIFFFLTNLCFLQNQFLNFICNQIKFWLLFSLYDGLICSLFIALLFCFVFLQIKVYTLYIFFCMIWLSFYDCVYVDVDMSDCQGMKWCQRPNTGCSKVLVCGNTEKRLVSGILLFKLVLTLLGEKRWMLMCLRWTDVLVYSSGDLKHTLISVKYTLATFCITAVKPLFVKTCSVQSWC